MLLISFDGFWMSFGLFCCMSTSRSPSSLVRGVAEDLSLPPHTSSALLQGFAAHHAGHMPAQRALVERLFERNLLKLIFATETLAVGIHMPARCVLINAQSKMDGFGLRLPNGTELLQMAGRAGRRSLDVRGHVVLRGPVSYVAETLRLGPEPLTSSFAPSSSVDL